MSPCGGWPACVLPTNMAARVWLHPMVNLCGISLYGNLERVLDAAPFRPSVDMPTLLLPPSSGSLYLSDRQEEEQEELRKLPSG